MVDDLVVASRDGGLLAWMLRKPWPDADEIIAAVRDASSPSSPPQ